MRLLLVSALFVLACIAQQPDRSVECEECKATVAAMEYIFANQTDVAKILDQLDQDCKQNFSREPEKIKICEDIMAIAVQIPEAVFQGLTSLAWDIPLGICATIFHCHVECCPTHYVPEQIHLSLTGDLSEMAVTWVTLNASNSIVQYGLSPMNLNMQRSGGNRTYKAGGWLGTIHTAIMVGLQPGTTYYYRVGDPSETYGWSPVFDFTTFYNDSRPITYALLGDMAYDNQSDSTVANLITLVELGKIQIVVHSGDISYADGFMPHWDDFFNKIEPIASRVPYMVTPGNHELWYNFSAYKHRFYMPGESSAGGSGDDMYYSWSLGGIHWVGCDSETPIDTADISPTQQAWISADLAKVNRSVTPWTIAYFHRPLYCSNQDDSNCVNFAALLREQVEDIFYNNKVDVVVTAHVHDWERTYPLYKQNATQFNYDSPTAPVYLVQGASGNREGNDNNWHDIPSWSAARSGKIGYATLTVDGNMLSFNFFAANSTTGPVLVDSFAITKQF